MRLIYMMEQNMRIVDYSLNCITKLFNTGQVNADLQMEADSDDEEETDRNDMESEMLESVAIESDISFS